MALAAGTIDPVTGATTGLTKALYEAMDAALRPPLEELLRHPPPTTPPTPPTPEAQIASAVAKAQANWKQLSYSLASGLVPVLRQEPALTHPPADPVVAETYSSSLQDPDFWKWLTGFVAVFQSWNPTTTDGINLKKALQPFIDVKLVPDHLRGIIR